MNKLLCMSMDKMEKYQHKEASRCNGTAVTYKLHKGEFPGEECLGQRLRPRISKCRDIHGALPTQRKDSFTFLLIICLERVPPFMFPTEV